MGGATRVLNFMPGGRHVCKRVAMDMSVGSLSNLGNERRKPLSIDIYQNLDFDKRNNVRFLHGTATYCLLYFEHNQLINFSPKKLIIAPQDFSGFFRMFKGFIGFLAQKLWQPC